MWSRYIGMIGLIFGNAWTTCVAQILQTNGAAKYIDDQCVLIEATPSFLSGTIWSFDQFRLDEDFDHILRINFNCSAEADGVAFVLQPTGAFAGSYQGVLGVEGLSPSLIVEIDIQKNEEHHDPAFDHLAVMRDGVLDHNSPIQLLAPIDLEPLDKCEDHWLRVQFDASDTQLSVAFNCMELGSVTLPGDLIESLANYHWGSTGGVGNSDASIEVCPDFTESDNDTTDIDGTCPNDTVTLISTLEGEEYHWTPIGLVQSPRSRRTNVFFVGENIFTVQSIDECGLRYKEVFRLDDRFFQYNFDIDTLLCSGETIRVDLENQPFSDRLLWNNGSIEPVQVFADPGSYWLSMQDGSCFQSDTVRVRHFDLISGSFDVTETPCVGEVLVLKAPSLTNGSILWTTGSTTDQIQITESGHYGYTAMHRCGSLSEEITVEFQNCAEVYFPSAFSPNGDGINDFFKPEAVKSDVVIKTLDIFDRWGNELLNLKNANLSLWQGWDGIVKGEKAPVGMYIYQVELQNGNTTSDHFGEFTLIR